MNPLTDWESFYVIVGSSAGALIGLQFVVISLMADQPVTEGLQRAGEAFLSPTVFHFGEVLFLAGVLSAPWHTLSGPAVVCGAMGLIGAVYTMFVIRRLRRQDAYQPVFEDHLFYIALPLISYVALASAAFAMRSHEHVALFAVAGSALLLLFIGIHNAWDSVTYNVFVHRRKQQERERISR